MNKKETISLAKLQLNTHSQILLDETTGKVTKLPHRMFDLLHFLMMNDGLYITRQRLVKEVWKETPIKKVSVDSHVARLRKIVGTHLIQTEINRGYRFDSNYYTRLEREV